MGYALVIWRYWSTSVLFLISHGFFLERRADDELVVAHNYVRARAGLFDVSHMLQHRFTGPTAQSFLMSLCPSSLDSLSPFSSTLSVLLNEEGGIIDDMIVTKQESDESFYVVTNAGRVSEDKAWIEKRLSDWDGGVDWITLDGWGLLALQGPKAAEVLQGLTDGDLTSIKFGQSGFVEVGREKVRCHVARGGYTGEDGFEVGHFLFRCALRA